MRLLFPFCIWEHRKVNYLPKLTHLVFYSRGQIWILAILILNLWGEGKGGLLGFVTIWGEGAFIYVLFLKIIVNCPLHTFCNISCFSCNYIVFQWTLFFLKSLLKKLPLSPHWLLLACLLHCPRPSTDQQAPKPESCQHTSGPSHTCSLPHVTVHRYFF